MYFVNSLLGWFHLITALLAMLAGAFVLATKKGTKRHKQIGYAYVLSMLLVCISAMGIYQLTGTFGIFHITAIVGFLTLSGGIIPMLITNLERKYKAVHVWFMYYSVLGLYAAFASELAVRIPDKPFYSMVGIATGIIFFAGTIFILKKEKVWTNHFIKSEVK
jgi:uncharacterized membrane protein